MEACRVERAAIEGKQTGKDGWKERGVDMMMIMKTETRPPYSSP
jgi:hypothetical protein